MDKEDRAPSVITSIINRVGCAVLLDFRQVDGCGDSISTRPLHQTGKGRRFVPMHLLKTPLIPSRLPFCNWWHAYTKKHIGNMGQAKLVYFACSKCGTPYWGREEPCPDRYSGRIDCEDCKASALEWSGFYTVVDCKALRLADIRPKPQRP
jgi:hypothetical protein